MILASKDKDGFRLQKAGQYVSTDGNYSIHKQGNRWRTFYQTDPLGREQFPQTPMGSGYRTLSEAKRAILMAQKGGLLSVQVRPLFRISHIEASSWFTACGQFFITNEKDLAKGGWLVLWSRMHKVPHKYMQGRINEWMSRHGLDLPVSTLKEATWRLEQAQKLDPLEELL